MIYTPYDVTYICEKDYGPKRAIEDARNWVQILNLQYFGLALPFGLLPPALRIEPDGESRVFVSRNERT
jgi:hypothetical protein